MAIMSSVNPATGEVLGRFEEISDAELEARLARSAQTFRAWRRRPFSDRAALLVQAAEVLEHRKEHWGRTMTLEMGKTFRSAVAEAEKCAWVCRFYAENAERFLADEEVKASATRSFVRALPLGPVLAVMPWNFPFWQVFRFAAPALMAGNVGLLKHASNVPQCALAIEEIFRQAGLPGRLLPDAPRRLDARRARRRGRPGGRRDAHRQRVGRRGGRVRGRQGDQEDGARARRVRSVRRDAVGEPRRGGRDRGDGPLHQQRPVLHRREAVHRPRSRLRPLRARVRPADGRAARRGSDGPVDRRRPARDRGRAREARRAGGRGDPRRRAPPRRRKATRRKGLLLPAHRARRDSARAPSRTARRSSGRSRCSTA